MKLSIAAVAGVALVAVSGSGRAALADQCTVVDNDVATWTLRTVPRGTLFVPFCEVCGDSQPGAAQTVSRIEVRGAGSSRHVAINGHDVDLAYVYVQTGRATFTNLAMMTGCATQGVRAFVSPSSGAPSTVLAAPGLPPACVEYGKMVDRLARCDKMPKEARTALRDAFTQASSAWRDLPADAKAQLADACRAGTDAVKQSAQATGC